MPTLYWRQYRDANPIPSSQLADDIATAPLGRLLLRRFCDMFVLFSGCYRRHTTSSTNRCASRHVLSRQCKPSCRLDYNKPSCRLDYNKPSCILDYNKPSCRLDYNKPSCRLDYNKPSCLLDYSKPSCLLDYSKPSCLLDYSKPSCLLDYSKPSCLLDYRPICG